MKGIRDGRWPGRSLAVAAIATPPAAYHHLFKSLNYTSGRIVDCWTDPYRWGVLQKHETAAPLPFPLFYQPLSSSKVKGKNSSLEELQKQLLGADSNTIVFLDNVSSMIDTFGLQSVVTFITTLRQNCATVVFSLHSDLHSLHEISTLCYGAVCVGQLGPAADRPDGEIQPHGRILFKFQRKSGAILTEKLDYRVTQSTGVTFLAPPPPPVAAGFKAPLQKTFNSSENGGAAGGGSSGGNSGSSGRKEATATTTTASAVGVIGQQLAGGMRLDVSAEEAAARREVQLPYEHQGQGQLYATGTDFRDYLPEAAGGRRQGQGRLGHILYVRDSDSEDPDSDEDPDDDLDV